MKQYDFGLNWSGNIPELFVKLLKTACQKRGYSFLWISVDNVKEVVRKLENDEIKIKFLLDTEATYNNSEIVSLIYKQSASLNSLLDELNKYSDDAYVTSILPELKSIQEVYTAAEESLNEEQFNNIVKSIESVRTTMVN